MKKEARVRKADVSRYILEDQEIDREFSSKLTR
jgi:hypothetical protein